MNSLNQKQVVVQITVKWGIANEIDQDLNYPGNYINGKTVQSGGVIRGRVGQQRGCPSSCLVRYTYLSCLCDIFFHQRIVKGFF